MGLTALLVVSSEDDGGAARSVWLLARDLPAAGVRAPVVVHRSGPLTDRLSAAGLPFEILPDLIEHPLRGRVHGAGAASALAANIAALPRAVRGLQAVAGAHGAGVLYGHGTWANYQVALAARLAGIHAVWHVRNDHSTWPVRVTGRTLARLSRPRAILAVSTAAGRPYRDLPVRLETVHNGADLQVSERARRHPVLRERLGLPRGCLVAGYAGRLVPHKGLCCLMEAARLALTRLPDLHLVILGRDPRHARQPVLAELAARSASWGIGPRVHLPGHVADVEHWLAGMDMVLVPSTYHDPCPRVVIESLAVGVPVIASRIGGIPEIVEDGSSGILVAPGSAAELAAAVEALASDPARRRGLGAAALEEASARYDSRAVAARVACVLRAL